MLNPGKIYRINKSSRDLIELLSPDTTISNVELFYKKSSSQNKFANELISKGINKSNTEKYSELDDSLQNIQQELNYLLKQNKEIKRTRLDLDIAKIFHKNLNLPRRVMIDYDFWRYITLFHFIELVKWRWENKAEQSSFWYANARAISGRALGLSLNKGKFEEDKSIVFTSRNQRIDCYRYWWIGNKLYDTNKGYYYIDKIGEKFKKEDASLQQFLLELEGSKLLSYEDRVAKIMADAILLSNKRYSESDLENCFRRYNAFSNRLFMEAEEKIIKKEICLSE